MTPIVEAEHKMECWEDLRRTMVESLQPTFSRAERKHVAVQLRLARRAHRRLRDDCRMTPGAAGGV